MLSNTILKPMVKGMDEIAQVKLVFKRVLDTNGKVYWKVELVPESDNVVSFLTVSSNQAASIRVI